MIKNVFITALFFISCTGAFSQDNTNNTARWLTWSAMQLLPSPALIHDGDADNNRINFGLRWQVTPVNFTFRANKYASPVEFFMINPVKRFSGSMEIFLQPEWSAGSFSHSKLNRWGIGAGSRVVFPIKHQGEQISGSLGAKYTYRESKVNNENGFWGIETGIYFYYGMVGLQFNYNFKSDSKFSTGLYLKFF